MLEEENDAAWEAALKDESFLEEIAEQHLTFCKEKGVPWKAVAIPMEDWEAIRQAVPAPVLCDEENPIKETSNWVFLDDEGGYFLASFVDSLIDFWDVYIFRDVSWNLPVFPPMPDGWKEKKEEMEANEKKDLEYQMREYYSMVL